MSTQINRSLVPRVAVDKTVERGIGLWELANKRKATPEIAAKIKAEVVRLATIMNTAGGVTADEARNSPIIRRSR